MRASGDQIEPQFQNRIAHRPILPQILSLVCRVLYLFLLYTTPNHFEFLFLPLLRVP